jgi:hypothetical protein
LADFRGFFQALICDYPSHPRLSAFYFWHADEADVADFCQKLICWIISNIRVYWRSIFGTLMTQM